MSVRDDAGFSLVEMLVVLVIIGLGSTLLTLAYRPHTPSSREVARGIANEARLARLAAMREGRPVSMTIDLAGRLLAVDGRPREIELPVETSLALKVAETDFDARSEGEVLFLPDGSSTGAEIVVGVGTEAIYEVRIFWLTGAISMRTLP